PAARDASGARAPGSAAGAYAPRKSVNDDTSGFANRPGRRLVCDSWDVTRLPSLHHGAGSLIDLHRRGPLRPYCSRSPARMPPDPGRVSRRRTPARAPRASLRPDGPDPQDPELRTHLAMASVRLPE